jgi:hypothetical protein
MRKVSFFKRNCGFLLCLALLLILSLSMLAGNSFAKYSKTVVLKGTVKYAPQSSVVMADVSVAPCDDIILTPGTTINTVTSVTVTWPDDAVPAYLYLELSGDHAADITSLGAGWTKLDGADNVFVYNNGTALTEQPAAIPVEGSFTADTVPAENNQMLQYKAYLIQQLDGVDAKDSFANMDSSGAAVKTAVAEQAFIPASAECTVDEKEYTVTNIGNIDTVIRATVVPNWVDDEGDPYYSIADALPAITFGDDWTQLTQDGVLYLYYNGTVAPNGKTSPMIVSVGEYTAPEDCTLQIDIMAEAMQTEPTSAYESAWHAVFNGETWTATASNP